MLKRYFNKIKDNNLVKCFIVILLYIMYQYNTLLQVIKSCGFDILKLKKTPRIVCFTICDLFYVIIIILLFKDELKKCLKDIKENFNDRSYLALTCWLVGSIIMTTSSLIISKIVKQDVSGNEKVVRESIKLAPLYMLFSCSIMAPFFEEVIFRKSINEFSKTKKRYILIFGSLITFCLIYLFGFKLKLFNKNIPSNYYSATIFTLSTILGYGVTYLLTKIFKLNTLFIITSGILFGALHIINSYNSPYDLLYIIPYGAMGAAFAYLLDKTDNVLLTISVHCLHNTILVISQIIRIIL